MSACLMQVVLQEVDALLWVDLMLSLWRWWDARRKKRLCWWRRLVVAWYVGRACRQVTWCRWMSRVNFPGRWGRGETFVSMDAHSCWSKREITKSLTTFHIVGVVLCDLCLPLVWQQSGFGWSSLVRSASHVLLRWEVYVALSSRCS